MPKSIRASLDAQLAQARPRALAALMRRYRDIDIAEEAFQEAAVRALRTWPDTRIPADPAAWLIRVGSNATIDRMRRDKKLDEYKAAEAPSEPSGDEEAKLAEAIDSAGMRDDVLRLLFMCCHPDLTVQDQLALALKVVAGLSVDQIAAAFVVRPKAMEQRITRAKKKAATVAGRLGTPTAFERGRRLDSVCLMIYLLFNEGYASGHGEHHITIRICDEAIRLARLVLSLFPSQPEVMGLLALCLNQHARHRARVGADGSLLTLEEQDRSLWHRTAIAEAGVLIEKALMKGRPGPYQIQAAIAAVHCRAKTAAETDWREIALLYEALMEQMPTPVVALNQAVAISKVDGPAAALERLAPIEKDLAAYLPFQVAKADFLSGLERNDEAVAALETALTLNPSTGQKAHIRKRIAEIASI
jgi:RNA polymerase sigma-70 factor (ECF subfamily)